MIKAFIYSIFIFSFLGCSFKTPPNEWQYKSTNAFNSYKKNFLAQNDLMAQNDLNRAINHAKVSANLDLLAHIYLGECALNKSVGINDECKKYSEIRDIVDNKKLNSYYEFINKNIKSSDISSLANEYQSFAKHLQNKEYKKANEDILKMSKATSILLSASLIQNHLTTKTRDYTIDTASFYGYKKAVIFWLKDKKRNTTDKAKKAKISKKISILMQ